MKILRKILIISAWLTVIFILLIGGFLLFITLSEFKPKPVEPLEIKGKAFIQPGSHKVFNLISWNIGYCGLGKEMDFFYDGGKKVTPPFDAFQKYLNGVYNFVAHSDSIDFILLQEVDLQSKRSYFTDQVTIFSKAQCDFDYAWAPNYRVKYIPFPLTDPLGSVEGGLLSLSRFKPSLAERYASPVNFDWPKRCFFLNRCFLKEKFPLDNGKELVMINLHNSAWDEGAALREQEIKLLKNLVLDEYNKGNFVIAGGDWNMPPPGLTPGKFRSGENRAFKANASATTLLPEDWKWVFDQEYPSNRDVNQAYVKGQTPVKVIDYFLLSPNIYVEEVHAIPTGFAYSDHQPVYLRIRLIDQPVADSVVTIRP